MDEVLYPTEVYGPDGKECEWSFNTKAQRDEFSLRYRMRMQFAASINDPAAIRRMCSASIS